MKKKENRTRLTLSESEFTITRFLLTKLVSISSIRILMEVIIIFEILRCSKNKIIRTVRSEKEISAIRKCSIRMIFSTTVRV